MPRKLDVGDGLYAITEDAFFAIERDIDSERADAFIVFPRDCNGSEAAQILREAREYQVAKWEQERWRAARVRA